MQSVKSEIFWSPTFEDHFLLWNNALQLFQVQELATEELLLPSSTRICLSGKTVADIVRSNNEYQYVKCVALCHGNKGDPLQQIIAVGQTDGKVSLTNFAHTTDVLGLIRKEFMPKHSRPVNALNWNAQIHHLLAAGFDKAGKDYSIYVIDVNKNKPVSSLSYDRRMTNDRSEYLQSEHEFSMGEFVHSLEFAKKEPLTLYAGTNNRQIKIYDLREAKSAMSVSTKAVFGISTDPWNERRFVSYIDNIVHLWDTRNLERPVLTLPDSGKKSISKLSWCPTRRGLISCVCRESAWVRVFDVQQTAAESEEDSEPAVISRCVAPRGPSAGLVDSFAWHPYHENRMLVAYSSGEVSDHVVRERITLSYSVSSTLVWLSGKKNVNCLDQINNLQCNEEDISVKIKRRAINGYGLKKDDLSENGLFSEERALQRLWTWLQRAAFVKSSVAATYKFQGVHTLLNNAQGKSKSTTKPWMGMEGVKTSRIEVFESEERSVCLKLCSWEPLPHCSLRSCDTQSHAWGFSRRAAVAVFNQQLPAAVDILRRAAAVHTDASDFNTTAIALAGFTSDRKCLWRETCVSLLTNLTDTYLKAAFMFLTSEPGKYDAILKDTGVLVSDRLAFACKYVNDAPLLEFVHAIKSQLTHDGDLDALLLTGLGSEGMNVLQRYVDETSDVQTAALVAMHASAVTAADPRSITWIETYRDLLNSLQLWKERVQIDVMRPPTRELSRTNEAPQQIHVTCKFCVKNSAFVHAPSKQRNLYDRSTANKLKMTACSNCGQPLPRCALCLQHMGTPTKTGNVAGHNLQTDINSIPNASQHANMKRSVEQKQFKNWFTWCQACRHGGHAQHMATWFKEHDECSVTNCSCKCMAVDPINKLSSFLNSVKL